MMAKSREHCSRDAGHIVVEQRKNVGEFLDHGHLHAAPMKRFGHLEADKPATNDSGCLRLARQGRR
jgi:hypothetical protein